MKRKNPRRLFIFYAGYRWRLAKVVALQFIASFADNLSILALLPIIQVLYDVGWGAAWIRHGDEQHRHLRGIACGYPRLSCSDAGRHDRIRRCRAIIRSASAIWLVLDIVSDVRTQLLRSSLINLRWPQFSRMKSGDWSGLQVTEIERFRPGLVGVLTLATSSLQALFSSVAALLVSLKLTLLAVVLGGFKVLTLRRRSAAPVSRSARTIQLVSVR